MGRPAEETETMTTSKAVLALCLVGAAVAAPQLRLGGLRSVSSVSSVTNQDEVVTNVVSALTPSIAAAVEQALAAQAAAQAAERRAAAQAAAAAAAAASKANKADPQFFYSTGVLPTTYHTGVVPAVPAVKTIAAPVTYTHAAVTPVVKSVPVAAPLVAPVVAKSPLLTYSAVHPPAVYSHAGVYNAIGQTNVA